MRREGISHSWLVEETYAISENLTARSSSENYRSFFLASSLFHWKVHFQTNRLLLLLLLQSSSSSISRDYPLLPVIQLFWTSASFRWKDDDDDVDHNQPVKTKAFWFTQSHQTHSHANSISLLLTCLSTGRIPEEDGLAQLKAIDNTQHRNQPGRVGSR